MSRFFEAIFVFGCSLVGFGMSLAPGHEIHIAARYGVHLVSFEREVARLSICRGNFNAGTRHSVQVK